MEENTGFPSPSLKRESNRSVFRDPILLRKAHTESREQIFHAFTRRARVFRGHDIFTREYKAEREKEASAHATLRGGNLAGVRNNG